ncbi:uncharacterized protein LOC121738350 [Aricia agestis]|uniref:uncharacterized protein LOC121738350 n=1 Tax=Aricia agestis TaxID=91739 RepID=UPI001C205375|nr:uncharacterized protein LOC121738350 [Aricia agestis]
MAVENMRRVFLLLMCFVQIFAQFQPIVIIQPLKPVGIRISVHELDPYIKEFSVTMNIKNPIVSSNAHKNPEKYYFARLANDSQGRWTYEASDLALQRGNILEYTFNYIYRSEHISSDYIHKLIVEDLVDPGTEAQLPACRYTPTVVRGSKVCGGQIIFEDNFDSLREDLWKLEQYISDDDFAFVSYQHPPNAPTISVAGGQLKIEPKLQQTLPSFNSTSITSGTLDLTDGCTASYSKCIREASDIEILPPVASGRMTAKLAFTYGVVEIRAKLPQGDWLYPDLLLQSVYEKYGVLNYASGVVRVAGAVGNMELMRGIRRMGNTLLYGGPMLHNACRKFLLDHKYGEEPWGNDFHVYSIRWAPDSIELYVDGTIWGRATPGTIGFAELFPKHCHLPPNMSATGARIAPFDELFTITLGIAAGGNLEFDDNTSNGDEGKPWRNSERKASLYFWQDVLSWWPRWTQPAMVVDYVKVYALPYTYIVIINNNIFCYHSAITFKTKMIVTKTGLVWLVFCLCRAVGGESEEWPVVIQALKPTGIRMLFPDIPGANVYVFQGNINRYINDYAYSTGEISANIVVTDDRVYENLEVALKPGDVVYYYYYYIKDLDGVFHKVEDQSFTVKELVDPDTDIEQMTETCLGSPTQVPDAKVCSNRIIFEDNFDQLRQDAWTLEQYIPAEPDYTFVSYQHDPRVRTITSSNGMLTIHPLLLGAIPRYNSVDSVYTAYLNLTDGCTSNLKAECEMQPSGASILPPLVSGRMTSKFAFKYGTVKIRAKLPKGDWLYPDILLQSIHVKHDASYFDTGVVRIAGARGNSVLKGEDVEYGNKVLYGGIMLDRACRGHLMNRTLSNKAWGDDFHVYSIRWAPESITFFVDGEEWHRVQPTSGTANLREAFLSVCQLPTNGTSKMAPFDDYFRLTLGVAAGGVLEFEDNLVSKDGVKKPWKNAGRKALFHFWQSQQSWWPSWLQEKAMVVDYETRWKGSKSRDIGQGYQLVYYGTNNKQNGVGVILDNYFKNRIVHVERKTDRILGDLNGHVGKSSKAYNRIHGGHGYGDENKEGKYILEFCSRHNLNLINTYFQKKSEHLITYKSGGKSSQIDFIVADDNLRSRFKDCKVIPGESLLLNTEFWLVSTACQSPQRKLSIEHLKLSGRN